MASVPAYSITTEAIAEESKRVGGDVSKIDVSRVVQLDTLDLPQLGPTDVHLRILAAPWARCSPWATR
jgi:hypothetical protein